MVVDEPRGLQMGVTNRGAEKFETPFFMSRLMASDSGDDAGISFRERKWLVIGFPPGKNDSV